MKVTAVFYFVFLEQKLIDTVGGKLKVRRIKRKILTDSFKIVFKHLNNSHIFFSKNKSYPNLLNTYIRVLFFRRKKNKIQNFDEKCLPLRYIIKYRKLFL